MLSAPEFFVTLSAFNVTPALVFPIVIAIGPEIDSCRYIGYCQDYKNKCRKYPD